MECRLSSLKVNVDFKYVGASYAVNEQIDHHLKLNLNKLKANHEAMLVI